MGDPIRILALAGSLRKESFNQRLVRVAARAAESAGAEIVVVDLADYPLPLFDADLERDEGPPPQVAALKKLFVESQGLLLASPEYNGSITGVLKNTIDWLSRPAPGEPRLAAFRGKVVGLLAASPGSLGGIRGLAHVRAILGHLGALVLPTQVALPKAASAFDGDDHLVDESVHGRVRNLSEELVEIARRLAG